MAPLPALARQVSVHFRAMREQRCEGKSGERDFDGLMTGVERMVGGGEASKGSWA